MVAEQVVLYVEDSDAFAYLLNCACNEAGLAIRAFRVSDGEEAMAFLRCQSPFESVPKPDLIFLDLNLPKKHGFEVLEELRRDMRLNTIPVVVLSSSRDARMRTQSLELGAAEYITKPFDYNALVGVIAAASSRYAARSQAS